MPLGLELQDIAAFFDKARHVHRHRLLLRRRVAHGFIVQNDRCLAIRRHQQNGLQELALMGKGFFHRTGLQPIRHRRLVRQLGEGGASKQNKEEQSKQAHGIHCE